MFMVHHISLVDTINATVDIKNITAIKLYLLR